MNPKVDLYFTDGCGRCPLGGTPNCKVIKWTEELTFLRTLVVNTGLVEELKWGVPCYTFQKNNVVIVAGFNNYCSITFLKGTLLNDAHAILSKPGENTQAARMIKFTSIQEIIDLEPLIKAYLFEAIEVEKAGLKVAFNKNRTTNPEEFQLKLDNNPELKSAFEALTPGRQRAYLLHFSQPKQAKTREARIEKHLQKILDGKGLSD